MLLPIYPKVELLDHMVIYGGSDSKASAYDAGDLGLIPGWGRSPREGNGNPLQYSFQENAMERGARQAIIYGVSREGHN